jgi:hypothetical protein
LDLGLWTLDFGPWTLDLGLWTLDFGPCFPLSPRHHHTMPLIKLNRINKGGEIVVNSDHILFVEVESRSTTIHLTGNLLFSVMELLDTVGELVEGLETARIRNAIQQSGLVPKPA